MALAVSVRFDFQDQKGKTSFTKVRVPNGFSIAQYTEFAQADVEEIGAFQFETVGGFPVYCNIPGILETVVAAGSDDIDQSDVDVAAFITAMETGIVVTGDTVSPTDVGEDSINNTVYARERFRASGKRG
jgi:hypothetical protein